MMVLFREIDPMTENVTHECPYDEESESEALLDAVAEALARGNHVVIRQDTD